jgi:hypothetical protein
VVSPYGNEMLDLLELLKPLLDTVPDWRIEQYSTGRRMEAE